MLFSRICPDKAYCGLTAYPAALVELGPGENLPHDLAPLGRGEVGFPVFDNEPEVHLTLAKLIY